MQFSFHDTADGHDVATDARIYQVVLDLTVHRLRHFAGIHVLDIVLDLLEPQPLKECRLRCVLLGVEDARSTVERDASVRSLPLAVDEGEEDLGLALVALELDGLDEDFDRADAEDGAPKADELVDQVRLYLGERVQLTVVEEADDHEALVLVLPEHM